MFYLRFAANADNYEMVMTAARHYWNACCPLVSQPIERELLREPIRIILECITATAEKLKKEKVSETKSNFRGGSRISGRGFKSIKRGLVFNILPDLS